MIRAWLLRLRSLALQSDWNMEWACLQDLVSRMHRSNLLNQTAFDQVVAFLSKVHRKRHLWCRAFMTDMTGAMLGMFSSNFSECLFSVLKRGVEPTRHTKLPVLLEGLMKTFYLRQKRRSARASNQKHPTWCKNAANDIEVQLARLLHGRPAEAYLRHHRLAQQCSTNWIAKDVVEVVLNEEATEADCDDINAVLSAYDESPEDSTTMPQPTKRKPQPTKRKPRHKVPVLKKTQLTDLICAETNPNEDMKGLRIQDVQVDTRKPHRLYNKRVTWSKQVRVSASGHVVCEAVVKEGETAKCHFCREYGAFSCCI